MTMILSTDELKLGDVVAPVYHSEPWEAAIVKKLGFHGVTLFRPYATNLDTINTGGIICLVGIEEYTVPYTSSSKWQLFRSQPDPE